LLLAYMTLQNPYPQSYPQKMWKNGFLDNVKIYATPIDY